MQHQFTHSRPPPPIQRPSSAQLARAESSSPTPPRLNNKLSANNLSMSKPPDSPPTTFDYPNVPLPRVQHRSEDGNTAPRWTTPTPRRASTEGAADHGSGSPLSNKSRLRPIPTHLGTDNTMLSASSTSSLHGIPFPSAASPVVVASSSSRARAVSAWSKPDAQDYAGFASALASGSGENRSGNGVGPPLDLEQLAKKSRLELERMLADADQLIRNKEQELSVFAGAGESLLQEYHSLRTRHDSLLSRTSPPSATTSPVKGTRLSTSSSAELRERPPPSPARAWRNSLGFPPTPSFSITSSPRRTRDAFTADHHQGDSHHTPLRHHKRLSSTSSVASLFAASPRTLNSSPTAQELQSLNQANYQLTLQLTELEADSEKAERDGKRKLRKLEKELQALRVELDRAEQRNVDLEEGQTRGRLSAKSSRELLVSQDVDSREDGAETEQSTPRSRPSALPVENLEDDLLNSTEELTQQLKDFAPPPFIPTSRAFSYSPDTPTNAAAARFRRSPGNGTPRILVDSPSQPPFSMGSPKSPEQVEDAVVAQLMAKIDELQQTNELLEEEREVFAGRLEEATRDIDEFKRRCEELEEGQSLEWEERKGALEWHQDDSDHVPNDGSPVRRLKGNRRAIQDYRRSTSMTFSPSDSSISETAAGFPPMRRSRTLGSELGSQWDDEDNQSARNDDEEEEDDGTEQASSAGTWTAPQRFGERRLRTQSSFARDDLDTSFPMFECGSLRQSGPADEEDYEQLARVADELPAAWEGEDGFSSPRKPGNARYSDWVTGDAGDDDHWKNRVYPETEEFGPDNRGMIESKEMVQSRASTMRRRKGKGKAAMRSRGRSPFVKRRGQGTTNDQQLYQDEEDLSPLSRRELALRRLGLSQRSASATSSRSISPTPSRRHHTDDEDDEYSDEYSTSSRSDEDDRNSILSDYDHLDSRGDLTLRGTDYYPVALRARYHPRMVALRMTDRAVQHLVDLVTYIQFFVVLGLALAFALWQGPKKTLGIRGAPRRIR